MSRYFFYFNHSFNAEFLGELLDEAFKLSQNPKNKVFFLTCGGVNRYCYSNRKGSKLICKWCQFFTTKVLSQFKNRGVTFIKLNKFSCINNDFKFTYVNSEQLRNISYRNVNIGLGIMSTYISLTRNMDPKIDNFSRVYFDNHLSQNVQFIDSLFAAIEYVKPDVIYSYNGRFEEYRPLFDIGISLAIQTMMIEDYIKDDKRYKVIFKNVLPHNITENSKLMNYCWDNYNLSQHEKEYLGRSFYLRRRSGEQSGDVKIFIADQKEGYAPIFNDSLINVAIMNSSEDEYAAVGSEWDALKLFKTQYEGIIYLLEHSAKNIHFYLRVHPNLCNVHYKYHTMLYELPNAYKNITVIPASSCISTYAIMEKSDKIVTFGSTMGIEASFWGKPSILLGPAFYYYDNVCYVPKNKVEMMLLINNEIGPIWSDNILKYGAYTMNKDPLTIDLETQYKYVNFNFEFHHFLKRQFVSSPFVRFIFNDVITAFVSGCIRAISDRHFYKIPTLED